MYTEERKARKEVAPLLARLSRKFQSIKNKGEATKGMKMDHDISVVRPELLRDDFQFRAGDMSTGRLKKIRKGLRTFHTLETMAVNIYKFQISSKNSDLRLSLIAAMCNEMTHLQDFQVKLCEYGFRPSAFRFLYWIVGFVFGFGSRLSGRKVLLKTGVWVEKKAVHHYDHLLRTVEWDADTQKTIEKDQADEAGHIHTWEELLKVE